MLGLRYTLRDFERYLYVNLKLEASRKQNGEARDNVLTLGIRLNF